MLLALRRDGSACACVWLRHMVGCAPGRQHWVAHWQCMYVCDARLKPSKGVPAVQAHCQAPVRMSIGSNAVKLGCSAVHMQHMPAPGMGAKLPLPVTSGTGCFGFSFFLPRR